MHDGFKIYGQYGDGEDGELLKEKVQTLICNNRMEVMNCVHTTLRTKKVAFCNWFRDSEVNRSPDELIIYCLSKMSMQHTVIFNKSFPWSTLSNYISYNDQEILERSDVKLLYLGEQKYAIIKDTIPEPMAYKDSATGKQKGRCSNSK